MIRKVPCTNNSVSYPRDAPPNTMDSGATVVESPNRRSTSSAAFVRCSLLPSLSLAHSLPTSCSLRAAVERQRMECLTDSAQVGPPFLSPGQVTLTLAADVHAPGPK